MAKNALVFSGRNGLDFHELRGGVVRIPEVTLRLREAQRILDNVADVPKIDLLSIISSDDELFFRNIQLKSLVAAIVQVGLFDRYMKTQKRPDFMVGNSNGDSAMMVCAGRQSFQSMVESSQALATLRTAEVVVPMVALAMPLLSGLSLTEYHALEMKLNESGMVEYKPVQGSSMELKKLVSSLHLEHGIARFVSIGPASALRGSDYRILGDGEIESLDSIDLDPMLGWFWRGVRPNAIALAQ
jgi:hypothetical protein